MHSIIQNEKECMVCKTTFGLEQHHLFFGNPDRKNSEKYGLKIWLCANHHRGPYSPHHDRGLDLTFKRMGQRYFEKTHSRDEFMQIFGRNYL